MLSLLPQFRDQLSCRFLTKNDRRAISEPCVRLHQVHGNRTIAIRTDTEALPEADGVITDIPGLHLTVRAADCQNFCIYHPEKHITGVLHAGWRGLLAGAIPEFFRVLSEEFDASAEETFVAAGPSLCLMCAEFADPQHAVPQQLGNRFLYDGHADLQGAATMQLLDAGVPRDHITRHPDCTCCHPDTYLTYRGGDKELVAQGTSNVLVACLL